MRLLVRLLDPVSGTIRFDGIDSRQIENIICGTTSASFARTFLFSKPWRKTLRSPNATFPRIGSKKSRRSPGSTKISSVSKKAMPPWSANGGHAFRRSETTGGHRAHVIETQTHFDFRRSLSAVDTETDLQIRSALKQEWKRSTVFIITHRITTAKEPIEFSCWTKAGSPRPVRNDDYARTRRHLQTDLGHSIPAGLSTRRR